MYFTIWYLFGFISMLIFITFKYEDRKITVCGLSLSLMLGFIGFINIGIILAEFIISFIEKYNSKTLYDFNKEG